MVPRPSAAASSRSTCSGLDGVTTSAATGAVRPQPVRRRWPGPAAGGPSSLWAFAALPIHADADQHRPDDDEDLEGPVLEGEVARCTAASGVEDAQDVEHARDHGRDGELDPHEVVAPAEQSTVLERPQAVGRDRAGRGERERRAQELRGVAVERGPVVAPAVPERGVLGGALSDDDEEGAE